MEPEFNPIDYPYYKEMMELDGWTLFIDEQDEGTGMTYFITHDVCPKGFQLQVEPIKGECSVMHWQDHDCQRCGAFPPEGLMTVYLLICDQEVKMNSFDETQEVTYADV
jgi:hypothetical protein